MLLTELINKGIRTISQTYPEGEAREMVLLFLENRLGTSRHTHILNPSYEVCEEAVAEALTSFDRMAAGEPAQYVIGKAWFYGREFNVTPDVLIPRPETEILCREVVEAVDGADCKGIRIADLCTGSGCIAWTLSKELPGSQVLGVDISKGALAVASGQSLEQENPACVDPEFILADVLGDIPSGMGEFDVLVSNPPYVMESEKLLMRRNVLEHEPALALFVSDEDPLVFYRAVASWASALLKKGGLCVVEINEALGKETADVFVKAGFHDVKVIQDLNSRDRFVSGIQ